MPAVGTFKINTPTDGTKDVKAVYYHDATGWKLLKRIWVNVSNFDSVNRAGVITTVDTTELAWIGDSAVDHSKFIASEIISSVNTPIGNNSYYTDIEVGMPIRTQDKYSIGLVYAARIDGQITSLEKLTLSIQNDQTDVTHKQVSIIVGEYTTPSTSTTSGVIPGQVMPSYSTTFTPPLGVYDITNNITNFALPITGELFDAIKSCTTLSGRTISIKFTEMPYGL